MLYFDALLLHIQEFIALIGIAIITFGGLRSVYQFFVLFTTKKITIDHIRLSFGESIILGLEFMVGADLIGSMVEPNYYNLGLLAILVAIRTVLSYFLNIELQGLSHSKR